MNTFYISGSVVELDLVNTFTNLSSSFLFVTNLYSAAGNSPLDINGSFSTISSNPTYELVPDRPANSVLNLSLEEDSLLEVGVSIYKYRPVFLAPGSASLIRLQPLPTLEIQYPRTGQIFPLGDGTESIQITQS